MRRINRILRLAAVSANRHEMRTNPDTQVVGLRANLIFVESLIMRGALQDDVIPRI